MSARVLVFGGRKFGVVPKFATEFEESVAKQQHAYMWGALAAMDQLIGVESICHGGATGADTLAGEFGTLIECEVVEHPVTKAEWKSLGLIAGPIRNQKMLDDFKPTHAIGFPGGRGTNDMLNRCKQKVKDGLVLVDLTEVEI